MPRKNNNPKPPAEEPKYTLGRNRASRHEGLDTNALQANRAKAKAGRKQRKLNQKKK